MKIYRVASDAEVLAEKFKNELAKQYSLILNKGIDNEAARNAVISKYCPSESLAKVLKRKKNDIISNLAILNPNCPKEEIVNWFMDVIYYSGLSVGGLLMKLENYRKDVHREIMERIKEYKNKGKSEIDNYLKSPEGIEDLKLIGNSLNSLNSFNLKRYAQEWYTEEVARTTSDPEILRKILERGENDVVSFRAALNNHCPLEVLAMVLKRGKKDNVSMAAMSNDYCPNEVVANWCEVVFPELIAKGKVPEVINTSRPDVGKIIRERIKERIREQKRLKNEEDNYLKSPEGIEDLKLIGSSLNLKRRAQEEKTVPAELWYNSETAWTTEDPEILRKILGKKIEDKVSCIAAMNPYCPVDLLVEILGRGGNDVVSRYAARNPNCPWEALVGVVRRRNCDEVSMIAANHENCPPEEAIRWYLKCGVEKELPDHLSEYLDKKSQKSTSEYFESEEGREDLGLLG